MYSQLRTACALLIAGALAGCATASSVPLAAADPANSASPVRPARYSAVTAGYVSQRPVAPKPWREQNDRMAPR